MRGTVRMLASSLLLGFAACGAGQHAAAENWPQQTVRIIVPFPAGSGIDVAARIIGDGLARHWQRPVMVENKPGGETTIGAGAFVAARDGHTLLYTTFGTLSVAPLTVEKLPFDPDADLVPLVPTVSVVVAISVTSSLSVTTLTDLEAVIRAKPGQLAWASGPTLPRYVFATFLKERGLQMNYVAYRDASQPQIDLGEGRIHAFIAAIPTSRAVVAAGKARFVATTEPRRTAILPDVPSTAESGYGELTFVGGAGLFGWRNMPPAIRERVITSANGVLSEAAVAERLRAAGQQVIGGGPEALKKLVEQQRSRVLEISKSIDLKSAR
jgi:tripartite-type tricarboxylate transporter receptor subunit TctC